MITDKQISQLKAGEYLRDPAPKGTGRLLVRATSNGAKVFYFRYTLPNGSRDKLPLGTYDPKGRDGLTLREVRQKAGELSRLYQSGVKDVRAHLERQEAAREKEQQASKDAKHQLDEEAQRGSLKALLEGYADALEQEKKITANVVRKALHRYVTCPYPELCARKASAIKTPEIRAILHEMIGRNIGRTTAQVRGYLHAAYQAAMGAENDPTAPNSLLGFGIEFNPIAAIPALSKFNKVGERNLNDKELGRYLRQVRRIPNQIVRSAMLLALLLGGQRMKQLLRVTPADLDLEGQTVQDSQGRAHRIKTVTLRDPKGRRVTPRIHLLPIHGEAEELFAALFQLSPRETPLFTNDGKISLCSHTTSHAVTNISKALEAEKLAGSSFSFGDLRRTCETLMAGMGISKDIRAQIQSHGLGGVQNRHYDKYRYLPEKSEALKMWTERLAQIQAEATNPEEEDKVAAAVVKIHAEKKLKAKLKANATRRAKGKV